MSDKVIPPTPSAEDYAKAAANSPDDGAWFARTDPFVLFSEWLEDAKKKEPNDANAMALSTVDADGMPDVRMVLLKAADAHGFVFYTNLESAKGAELAANPKAALLFHWKSLRRQVRVRGVVTRTTDEEADAYFATRARPAQIGAWASAQSRTLPDRLALEKKIAEVGLRFGLGKVTRPPHWSGFRIVPQSIEFWRDRPFRLHERLLFETAADGRGGAGWTTRRLFP